MDNLSIVEMSKEDTTEIANSLGELSELQLAHIGGGCGETIAY